MPEQTLTSIKCLVLDDSVIYAERLTALLTLEPGFEVHTSRTGFGEELRAARKYHPDVILLSGDTPGAASVVENLDNALPDVPVVVVFSEESPQLAHECILAGARFCLFNLEDREDVVGSLRRLIAREKRRRSQIVAQASDSKQRLARVIAFHSAKGGAGTTTLAVNAAIALATHLKKRVVIVDAALQSTDVGVFLDLDHSANITDLIAHIKELDEDLLNEIMARHDSGVQVLLGPSEIEHAEMITSEQFSKILAALRKQADYIIIDTPPVLDAIAMTALDTADQIVLLSTPEVPALRNTARFLQLSAKLGYPPEKLFLLLNRVGSKGAVSLEDIKQHLRVEVAMKIKSYGGSLVPAVNKGSPVAVKRSRFGPARSFRELAEKLDVHERAAKKRQRTRISALLRSSRQAEKGRAEVPVTAQNA